MLHHLLKCLYFRRLSCKFETCLKVSGVCVVAWQAVQLSMFVHTKTDGTVKKKSFIKIWKTQNFTMFVHSIHCKRWLSREGVVGTLSSQWDL